MVRFVTLVLLGALIVVPAISRAESSDVLTRDKALHFAAGLGIASLGYMLGAEFFDHPGLRVALGGGLALAAGGAKELYDLAGHGAAEWWDLAFDLLGACTGLLIAFAIDRVLAHRRRLRQSSPGLRPHRRGLVQGVSW